MIEESMQEIGSRIGETFTQIEMIIMITGLTLEDLKKFDAYLDNQDTMMPLINPTYWMKGGDKQIKEARERVEALRSIIPVIEKDMAKKAAISC